MEAGWALRVMCDSITTLILYSRSDALIKTFNTFQFLFGKRVDILFLSLDFLNLSFDKLCEVSNNHKIYMQLSLLAVYRQM